MESQAKPTEIKFPQTDRTTLIECFEEKQTNEERNGHCSGIAEAIGTMTPGSLCGFRTVSQIHQWAELRA